MEPMRKCRPMLATKSIRLRFAYQSALLTILEGIQGLKYRDICVLYIYVSR